MAKRDDKPEDEFETGFTPDIDEDEEIETYTVKLDPAKTSADFKNKANELVSNAMDVLNARICSGMAEASDLKTALEFGKLYKVGMETVSEAAERALKESDEYAGVDESEAETEMRFEE